MSERQEKRRVRRFAIGFAGTAVLIVGIIAIPYPGPGWLIVFAGLAILSQEFPWAKKVLDYLKVRYDTWLEWVKCQRWPVRFALGILTAIIVVLTIYLLNGYGLLNSWFHLGQDWLTSPLFK